MKKEYSTKVNEKILEYIKLQKENSFDTKSVYKYDDKNNQIEFNRFNADGKLQFKNINKFDSKGNEVERSTYGLSGNISGRYTSSFDNEGNKIEYLSYNSNGNLKNKTTYEYDGNSKTIKSFNSDGTPEKKEVFKYDDKGNEIEYAVYEQRDHFEATYYSEYLFDEVGMNRIEACFDPNNPNSGKVMAKCGMKYEGTIRRSERNNQGICDSCWYGILAEER